MRVVVITGAPGAGKTETGRMLVDLCPPPSAWVDTDWMAAISPFRIDPWFHAIVGQNLRSVLQNYLRAGARVVVLSGVVVPGGILDELAPLLAEDGFSFVFYALQAPHEVLTRRIVGDAKPQGAAQRLEWLWLNERVLDVPGAVPVDTSSLPVAGVARRIAAAEGFTPDAGPGLRPGLQADEAPRERCVELDAAEIEAICVRVLEQRGVSFDTASKVASALIENEHTGYPSHGLLRLPEYVEELRRGAIQADARPTIEARGPYACVVDGHRSFGALSAEAVASALTSRLEQSPVAVVGLVNSSHVGRLAAIGAKVTAAGYVVLGFANYLGAGQKVVPFGGRAARLATNPILFAFPAATHDPVIVDMTTSVVSEGRVRTAMLAGERVPEGWLADAEGRPVTDPRALYGPDPTAFLTPLGGPAGHKGFALALAVEVLAGIVTGAGAVSPTPGVGGNGGLFIGLRPDVLGADAGSVRRAVHALIDHLNSAGIDGRVRIPGHRRATGARVRVLSRVWDEIRALDAPARSTADT
jgi:LDH2 family malate/lactate/ureidoglycolate dehydrogenase